MRPDSSHAFFSLLVPNSRAHSRFVGSSFVLPGEGQKIGRVMEAFARRYHNCNPDNIFADAGTHYPSRSALQGPDVSSLIVCVVCRVRVL
jgi:hypothetical protein